LAESIFANDNAGRRIAGAYNANEMRDCDATVIADAIPLRFAGRIFTYWVSTATVEGVPRGEYLVTWLTF
jgi:hypothetical protein